MKRNVRLMIYCLFFIAATMLMTMCGGTGTPPKPGDGLITTTENLPDGTVFTVTAPRSVTCSVVSDTSGYPPGFKGYIIDISGTLNPGEKAILSFKGIAAFDDTDQIAYYSGSVWVPVATTLSADKFTISSTVDHFSDWAICFDIWPPWVVEESVSPTDGAVSVPVTSPVIIEFNEKMDESSVQNAFSLVDQFDVEVQGDVSWNSSGTLMTFTPGDDLEEITTYSITVTVNAQDFTGNNMESDFSSEFTTGFKDDTVAPQVVSVSPGDGEEDVFVEANITITFSEPMNQVLTEAALRINGAAPTGSFSWVGNIMMFDPASNLENGTEYQMEVTTDAQDVAGNPLATGYSWAFTTISAETNIVSGTLTLPSGADINEVNGKDYFVVIDNDMGVATWFAMFSGTWGYSLTASYELTDVVPGTYYIYAVLDITGDGLEQPSVGDYTGSYGNIVPPNPPNAVVPSSGSVMFNIDLYETGNNVSGTLTYTGSGDPDGKTYIATIVDDFQTETPVAMYTDTWPSGTDEAPYQFKNVDAGTYIIYAILYDEFTEFDIPDAGDYVGSYGNLDFWTGTPNVAIEDIGNYTDLDFDMYEWSTLVGVVKGTVNGVPSGSEGAYYWVGLLDEYFMAVAVDAADEGYLGGSVTSFEYSVNPVPPGNYYAFAFIDMDSDEELSNGDYIGYYGGTEAEPPAAENIFIPSPPSSGLVSDVGIDLYEYTLEGFIDEGDYPSIAVDQTNNVHISYVQEVGSDLILRYQNLSDGVSEEVDLSALGYDKYYSPSLAVDDTGTVHVCFIEAFGGASSGQLVYGKKPPGGVFSFETFDEGYADVSMGIDSNSKAHIVYYNVGEIYYMNNVDGSWRTPELIDTVGGQLEGMYISIAVGQDHLGIESVHISYVGGSLEDNRYAKRAINAVSGSAWDITQIAEGDFQSGGNSIAVDSDGFVHMSYFLQSSENLKYATNSTGSWVTNISVDDSEFVGLKNSIAVDSQGYVHISYNGSYYRNFWYATNASGGFVLHLVDDTAWSGSSNAIAVDNDDNVYIIYESSGNIMMASP